MERGKRTLPTAGELDSDALVDVLGEIEDGLSTRLVCCLRRGRWASHRSLYGASSSAPSCTTTLFLQSIRRDC